MKTRVNPAVTAEVNEFARMQVRLLASLDGLQGPVGLDTREIDRFEFDANNESEYLSHAKQLSAGDPDPRRRAINSHCRKVPLYRRMLDAYRQLPPDVLLSHEQIKSVLDAAYASR